MLNERRVRRCPVQSVEQITARRLALHTVLVSVKFKHN